MGDGVGKLKFIWRSDFQKLLNQSICICPYAVPRSQNTLHIDICNFSLMADLISVNSLLLKYAIFKKNRKRIEESILNITGEESYNINLLLLLSQNKQNVKQE